MLLQALGWPFVLAANLQNTPTELWESQWPQSLETTIVLPEATEFTCKMWSRRIIDFVVCSERVRPLLKKVVDRLKRPLKTAPSSQDYGQHEPGAGLAASDLQGPTPLQAGRRGGAQGFDRG